MVETPPDYNPMILAETTEVLAGYLDSTLRKALARHMKLRQVATAPTLPIVPQLRRKMAAYHITAGYGLWTRHVYTDSACTPTNIDGPTTTLWHIERHPTEDASDLQATADSVYRCIHDLQKVVRRFFPSIGIDMADEPWSGDSAALTIDGDQAVVSLLNRPLGRMVEVGRLTPTSSTLYRGRIYMCLLDKAFIGEVEPSAWPPEIAERWGNLL